MRERAYIFLNGELLGEPFYYLNLLKEYQGDIFCGDGGYHHCLTLGVEPLEIWGDMDSISEEIKETANYKRVKKREFRRDKDNTDGELLIEEIHKRGYQELVVIAGLGGRKSHELTNLNLLIRYPKLKFITEFETITLAKSEVKERVGLGRVVSFIPFSEIKGLTLKGLEYPLKDYTLKPGDSRCMSNISVEEEIEAIFSSGNLLMVVEKRSEYKSY